MHITHGLLIDIHKGIWQKFSLTNLILTSSLPKFPIRVIIPVARILSLCGNHILETYADTQATGARENPFNSCAMPMALYLKKCVG